ncbi:hypothetical protein HanIR_Chr11g0504041 [Helianthus annuus]|nr:hypothetical protein HanIR_Chr11g0504041 [Helianthus annuus]
MGDIKATMCGIPPVTSASMALHRPLPYFLGVRGRYGGGSIPVTSANGMCRREYGESDRSKDVF